MRRRQYLAALGTAAVAIGSGCSSPQHGDGIEFQNGSFEQGLDHWVPRTDLPADPNTGNPVIHNFAQSPAHASDGAWSVELFIDGRPDDGTLWVQQ